MKPRLFLSACLWTLLASLAAADDSLVIFKNIPYMKDAGERQQLDIYLPAGYKEAEKPMPLVLIIHGGGWENGDKNFAAMIAKWFINRGYAVAANNYRFVPKAPMPAQIIDCKSAVRWLRANAEEYNLDTERFAAWGISAGGHLTAMLATTGETQEFDVGEYTDQSSKIQAACVVCGPQDFIFWADDSPGIKLIFPKLFDGFLVGKKELITKMSPRLHVTKETAPMLLLHAEDDQLVPVIQAQKMDETLAEAGVPHELHVFPAGEGGHVTKRFFDEEGQKIVGEFLEKFLK